MCTTFGIMSQAMLRLFAEQHALWQRAVAAMAHLDALMSLAGAAALSDGPMCRPEFIRPGPFGGQAHSSYNICRTCDSVLDAGPAVGLQAVDAAQCMPDNASNGSCTLQVEASAFRAYLPDSLIMRGKHQADEYDAGDSADAVPAFLATALRHPAAAELHATSFVPNDVHLGGEGAAPFIVLTGEAPALLRLFEASLRMCPLTIIGMIA